MVPYVHEYMKKLQCGRYDVVTLVAQRARQINDGIEVYVKTSSRNPVAIALEEIMDGKIQLPPIEEEKKEIEETTVKGTDA